MLPQRKEKGEIMAQFYCKTCRRTMEENEFYQSYRLDRYPEGRLPECKKCLTRHVDNYDPETYKWILEEIDVPEPLVSLFSKSFKNDWHDCFGPLLIQNEIKAISRLSLGRQ